MCWGCAPLENPPSRPLCTHSCIAIAEGRVRVFAWFAMRLHLETRSVNAPSGAPETENERMVASFRWPTLLATTSILVEG